jgi:hypothetical protein
MRDNYIFVDKPSIHKKRKREILQAHPETQKLMGPFCD